MKCPCTPECKSRNTYCHTICKAYKLYEIAKQKEYKEREKQLAIKGYYFEQINKKKVLSSRWD